MEHAIRVIQYGIGAIGSSLTRLLAAKRWVRIVGAVDIDEEKAGKDLGEVAGLRRQLGVSVSSSLEKALSDVDADVVVHSTVSRLRLVWPQICGAVEKGLDVVSSCEELAYPWRRHPELAHEIDEFAKSHGSSVLGTGVNPGFVMDSLVLMLTAACQEIEAIEVHRVVDASTRRLPLQKKIGAGMTVEEFQAKVAEGSIGHVGLEESMALVADSLSWRLDAERTSIEPVIAEKTTKSSFLTVEPGRVLGLRQTARATTRGREVLSLELGMYLGAEKPLDAIRIKGVPNLDVTINGGVAGDAATVAIIVNILPRLLSARPGLLTMRDVSLPFAVLEAL